MPVMTTGDVEIYYEEHGRGVPVLCFAPGSLRSHIDYWHCSPKEPTKPPAFLDPTVDLAGDFRVVAMDQRNARRRARAGPPPRGRGPLRAGPHRADGPSGHRPFPRAGRLHRRELLPEAMRARPRPHHERRAAAADRPRAGEHRLYEAGDRR